MKPIKDNVIDIEAAKPVWANALVKCRNCFYEWSAVYHIKCDTLKGLILECPRCSKIAKVKKIRKFR
jgi:hypothetical protein